MKKVKYETPAMEKKDTKKHEKGETKREERLEHIKPKKGKK